MNGQDMRQSRIPMPAASAALSLFLESGKQSGHVSSSSLVEYHHSISISDKENNRSSTTEQGNEHINKPS